MGLEPLNPPDKGTEMITVSNSAIINCDECHLTFDIFTEGFISDIVPNYPISLCGKCWQIELVNRAKGNRND